MKQCNYPFYTFVYYKQEWTLNNFVVHTMKTFCLAESREIETKITSGLSERSGGTSKLSKLKLLRQLEIMERTRQSRQFVCSYKACLRRGLAGYSTSAALQLHIKRSHGSAETQKTIPRITKSKVPTNTKIDMKCPRCERLIKARWW